MKLCLWNIVKVKKILSAGKVKLKKQKQKMYAIMTQVFGTANQMTYHSSSHTLTFKKKCKSECTAADGTSIHNLQTHNYSHVTDYYLVL